MILSFCNHELICFPRIRFFEVFASFFSAFTVNTAKCGRSFMETVDLSEAVTKEYGTKNL